MSADNIHMLVNIVKVILDNEEAISREVILDHIEKQCNNPLFASVTDNDKETALKTLLVDYSVWMNQEPTVLSDNTDHEEWLADHRKDIDFTFWERYQTYLQTHKGFPSRVIKSLDKTTDIVLGYLEHPRREGAWRRRPWHEGQIW